MTKPFHIRRWVDTSIRLGLFLLIASLPGCHSPKEKAEIELKRQGISPDVEAAVRYAATNRIDLLQLLDQAGVSMGAAGRNGQTPLLAALDYDSSAASAVLKMTPEGAVDFPDKSGRTALSYAVEKGLDPLVCQLLARRASPEKTGGESILLSLLGRDSEALFGEVLARCNDDSPLFPAALILAMEKDRPQIVQNLLERKVSPDLLLPNGHAMLYEAYARKQSKIVDLLLAHGAKCPESSATGMDNILNLALQNNDPIATSRFLAIGASPQAPGKEGKTPLQTAIATANLPILELFLQHGVNYRPYVPQIIGSGQVAILELLVKNGFDLNQPNSEGELPLQKAIRVKNIASTQFFLEHGCPMDTLGSEGQTAFSMAVLSGKTELVQLFLDRTYDPNTPFLSPPSPAFLAATGSDYFNKWLLKDEGFSPLMLAAARGEVPLIQTLLKGGAKRGQTSKNWQRYAINFACNTEHIPAAQLLLGRDPATPRDTWINISLSDQKATVYRDGAIVRSTRVSTGKAGKETPPGTYVITDKQADWKSSIYKVKMPYFMRLSCLDFGLHQGNVVDHAASHGCIRLPKKIAAELFQLMAIGDPVFVQ